MTTFVTSADGTRIAFDRLGSGPPVVLVSGMFCHRPATRPLADLLAERFTVVNYDRRGRGESGDTAPYAPERELEDLAALIDEVGGTAAVYGHSSGAGLALHAAAGGLDIPRLVLHEPPYGPDDEGSRRAARQLAEDVAAALAEGRPGDAIRLFLADSGLPAEAVTGMAEDPAMRAVAPTMPHDFEVMGDLSRGGALPEEVVRQVGVPTLVVAGSASPGFFLDTAALLTKLLRHGEQVVLDGQGHGAPAEVVAPVVAAFLAGAPLPPT
jgi:pimeloyl-ACP methyl ester carboxylesterase